MTDLERTITELMISRGYEAVVKAVATACCEMGKRDKAMGYDTQNEWVNKAVNLNADAVLRNPEAKRRFR